MNELGFEALVMLSLIHGTKAETLVYTAGCAPRQPRGPCLSQLPEVATMPTTSYLPLVTSQVSLKALQNLQCKGLEYMVLSS